MEEKTNRVRKGAGAGAALDDVDRRLLSLIAADATRSYAALGEALHLSAPAVHERVKRLKQDGVIKGTVAVLDGPSIGRPLLAFIQVKTRNWATTLEQNDFTGFPDIEEVHTITGQSDVLLKVRTRDTQALEEILARIQGFEGIDGTHCIVALSTYLERGPSP